MHMAKNKVLRGEFFEIMDPARAALRRFVILMLRYPQGSSRKLLPMKTPRLHRVLPAILCTIFVLVPQGQAQTYPTKPLRLIVPSSPGSGYDVVGRIAAAGIAENLGQQVIVDNRAGASGNIGAELAAKAPADGYTLLLGASAHTSNVITFRNQQFDFVRDFAPITVLAAAPSVVTVHPSLPVKSLADLVKLAKARPGQLNYGSTGVGGTTHIGTEMFMGRTGIKLLNVPYRGGGEAAIGAISGEIAVYLPPVAPALPHIRSGKLRLLAVTSAERIALLPDTPTVAETGYPRFEFSSWNGILVPAKTPKDISAQVLNATLSTLKNPTVNKRLLELGYVVGGNQPDQFAADIKAEIAAMEVILGKLRGTME